MVRCLKLAVTLFVLFLSPLINSSAEALSCQTVFKKIAKATLGGLYYPVIGPVRFIDVGNKHWKANGIKGMYKVPFQIIKEDKSMIAGALILTILSTGVVTFSHEINEEIEKIPFDKMGPSLSIEGSSDQFLHTHFLSRYSQNHISLKFNPDIDPVTLLREHMKSNQPFSALFVFDHGSPGTQMCGSSTNIYWAEIGRNKWMKKDAVIVLGGCSVGSGPEGEAYMQKIGRQALPQGGWVVAASNMRDGAATIPAYLLDKITGDNMPPELLKWIEKATANWFRPTYAAVGGPYSAALKTLDFETDPVKVIRIDP